MARIKESFSVKEFEKQFKNPCVIKPSQFYGLDNDPFAVELAKVTLMIAKKLVLDEAVLTLREEADGKGNLEFGFAEESALPLDNLDNNIICADALFTTWPEVDYIIGNPPFQSKNKAQEEMGGTYLNALREKYPDIDGRADYCVYWFRIAHDCLKLGQSAGLVATNTIRQNYTREAGLDYITAKNGVITEAVSDMIWPGEAVVHVSIVNWTKGVAKNSSNRLYRQVGNQLDAGWSYKDLTEIGPSLSDNFEVGKAKKIKANAKHGMCFQGQTHGHKAFLISPDEAKLIIKGDHKYEEVLKPFMISDDLVGKMSSRPSRYVIDFSGKDILAARQYEKVFGRIETSVLPDRQTAALKEEKRNSETLSSNPNAKINKHHTNFLNKWWRMSYERQNMMVKITEVKRYIVCGRVTKRPIFDFVSSKINPNDALTVFCYDDDYSFGILQSSMHWEWFNARCSTIKSDPRYTSNTVFDSFVWPQKPTENDVEKVAKAAVEYRLVRKSLTEKYQLTLRELHRQLEVPGENPLKKVQENLDIAVRGAFKIGKNVDFLEFMLSENSKAFDIEKNGGVVEIAGLPSFIEDQKKYISDDCILP